MKPCQQNESLTARFNTPLIIEQPIFVSDGGGGRQEQWSFVAKVWAQVETQSAKESEHDGHLVMKREHHIYMRPQNIINATMRFVYQDRHYYITGYFLTSAHKKRNDSERTQQVLCCFCEEFDVF